MPFRPNDIRRVGEILAFAARTEIMPRFRRLTATQVREKSSPLDLVTEADEVAEAVITTGLKVAFPGAIVEVGIRETSLCQFKSNGRSAACVGRFVKAHLIGPRLRQEMVTPLSTGRTWPHGRRR